MERGFNPSKARKQIKQINTAEESKLKYKPFL